MIKTMLETWDEWDDHYYETIVFQKVKDALETNFCVTIIGAAGEGKTVTARHAAFQYQRREEPYTILPIDDPEELTKAIKLDKSQFVILEDPLGKQHLDESSLQIWIQQSKKLRYSLMDSPIKIVVTMRKSIFRYYQTRIKDTIFHANVIDLSSESNRLSIEEKQGILEQNIKHLKGHIDSDDKKLILNETYYPGFPLMCYKLSADSQLTKITNLDPFPMILEHINEFSNSEPFRYHYCCLVLAFMHNCVFDINDFTLCQNADFAGDDETAKEKIENIIKSCNISSKDENCFSNLKNSFEALSGSFFAYKPPMYTILHDSITRAVAYTYGIINTRILLEYSDSAVIREFVRIKSDTNEGMYSNEKIIIDPTCQKQLTNQLAKRCVCDIEQGNTLDVFRNPSCLNETFQRIFYKVLNKSDVLLQLMSRSPKQLKQSIRYSERIDKDTKCPFDNIIALCTPVHWLCSLGLKQILELVMSRSENKPEFLNSLPGRVKPLHIAAGHGHLEVVKYLIEDICVNVNEQLHAKSEEDPQIDERYAGWSPLHFAASQNFHEVVSCLLQNNADPNLINDHGCSSMLLAAGSGYSVVVDYLLSYGGNPNISCNDGTTPLMLAAQEGHVDTMLTLIDGKADVNLQNNEEISKQSALFLAARNGRIQCVKKLIDKDADKELSDFYGTSPLLVALLNDKYETAKYLFQLGASINAKNIEGKSPLEVSNSLNINIFDQV